jgi:hypothetical protein
MSESSTFAPSHISTVKFLSIEKSEKKNGKTKCRLKLISNFVVKIITELKIGSGDKKGLIS